MKTYIKPNTEICEVKIEQIMQSVSGKLMNDKTTETPGFQGLGKENEISSPSLWDEEE